MTNLPQEATGATALSARWNALLNKLQNASDTDVRIRGRKISAGTFVGTTGSFSNISGSGYSIIQDEGISLTSRSTVTFVGTGVTVTDIGSKTQVSIPSGGAAAYYGVKAEDYITSGAGTRASPYNASAIENAINALPAIGGIVFIKAGFYSGTRINLGRTGEAGRAKSIILRGESTDLSGLNAGNYDAVSDRLYGTWMKCGFRINTYGCQIAFQNLMLEQPAAGGANLLFEGKINDEAVTSNNALPLGGFRIQDCKLLGGDPAIHVTPQDLAASDVQNWNVLIERVHIREGVRGIRIEDTTAYNGIFRGNVKHCVIQALTGQAIFVDIANLKGIWEDIIVEDCGSGSTPTVSIRCARAGPGFEINSLDYGDTCNSTVDGRFESYLDGPMYIKKCHFGHQFSPTAVRRIELVGLVDFEGGSWDTHAGVVATINVISAEAIIIRQMHGNSFVLGTITNPENVLIVRGPKAVGFIGSSTLGASPATYTNNDSYIENVMLVGGTITDVTRNGQSVGAERSHILAPGQAIVISYSSAPTVRRFGIS